MLFSVCFPLFVVKLVSLKNVFREMVCVAPLHP